jgi:hypothetical protein
MSHPMRKGLALIGFGLLFVSLAALRPGRVLAQSPDERELLMLENLRRMRTRQQEEEKVVRIQGFMNVQKRKQCTPVQQARQRIRDIEASSGEADSENVNVTAGHGEINVSDNHGTINSDINVHIINQGEERDCL